MPQTATSILLVEDDPIITMIISDLLVSSGYRITAAENGETAWEYLQNAGSGYDLVLLDRNLPDMDGAELLRRLKGAAGLSQIPVIFESGHDDKEMIREGMELGAYYYLIKPVDPGLLLAVVNAAIMQTRELREMIGKLRMAERPIALMKSGVFHFRDPDEGRLLANYLALSCPKPEQAILGLQELLLNAVEHGNLGISYAEKGALLLSGKWQEEIRRRLELAEYKHKYVEVQFLRQEHEVVFAIRDQGDGFRWQEYMEFSPERAFDLHGRGIAMARKLSFDALDYQGAGNAVTAAVSLRT